MQTKNPCRPSERHIALITLIYYHFIHKKSISLSFAILCFSAFSTQIQPNIVPKTVFAVCEALPIYIVLFTRAITRFLAFFSFTKKPLYRVKTPCVCLHFYVFASSSARRFSIGKFYLTRQCFFYNKEAFHAFRILCI